MAESEAWRLDLGLPCTSVAGSPDRTGIAVATKDGAVRIVNASKGFKLTKTVLRVQTALVTDIAWHGMEG